MTQFGVSPSLHLHLWSCCCQSFAHPLKREYFASPELEYYRNLDQILVGCSLYHDVTLRQAICVLFDFYLLLFDCVFI